MYVDVLRTCREGDAGREVVLVVIKFEHLC